NLLNESVRLGLRTTVTPSATPLLTLEAIERIQQCGVARMAISLDGPDSGSHDGFRRVDGSFDRTILALEHAQRIGLQTQVNTTVTRHAVGRLGEIAHWVERYGARLWSVFFLVPTGRALASQDLTAEEYEEVFAHLYDLSKTVPFDIKTTEAQHYRRYVAQRRKAAPAAAARLPLKGSRDRPASTMARALSLSHTRERSIPAASCPCPPEMCDAIRSRQCTVNPRYFDRFAMPPDCKVSAAHANTATCAAARGRAPTRLPGI